MWPFPGHSLGVGGAAGRPFSVLLVFSLNRKRCVIEISARWSKPHPQLSVCTGCPVLMVQSPPTSVRKTEPQDPSSEHHRHDLATLWLQDKSRGHVWGARSTPKGCQPRQCLLWAAERWRAPVEPLPCLQCPGPGLEPKPMAGECAWNNNHLSRRSTFL